MEKKTNSKVKNFLSPIRDFFRSVKLAIGLICYFTLTAILATLVPQARELTFYAQMYPPFLSWLITSTGFHHFFTSFLFIFPMLIFTINLVVCMLHRLGKEIRSKGKKYFGPDVIHVGILILIAGALVTFLTRQEAYFTLREGEKAQLAGKYLIQLEKFEYIQYEDGRPKAWISTVSVNENGKVAAASYPLQVNKPLALGGVKIYQTSYTIEKRLLLQKAGGDVFAVAAGHPVLSGGGTTLVFGGSTEQTGDNVLVVFDEYRENVKSGEKKIWIGGSIGDFSIVGIDEVKTTGLTAVKDAGFLPIMIASLLIALGLSWTYIQKIGEKRI